MYVLYNFLDCVILIFWWKLGKRANAPEVDCRQVENDFSGLLENFLRVSEVAKLEGHKD